MSVSIARIAPVNTFERVLTSGVMEHPVDTGYGKLFFVIDIPFPPAISHPIEQLIRQTITEEYFETDRRSPVYQFEDCLKKLNSALQAKAEIGPNEWVGHLHAALALLAGDELFVSFTGKVLATVIRAHSQTPIVDPTTAPSRLLVHKTFANLISGQLAPGDTLVLGNNEVSRHFSPQFIQQAIAESPMAAIQAIFQAARRLKLHTLAAVIARFETEENEAPTEPYTILLDQPLNDHSDYSFPLRPRSSRPTALFAFARGQIAARLSSIHPQIKKISQIISSDKPQVSYEPEPENQLPSPPPNLSPHRAAFLERLAISLPHPTLKRTTGLKFSQTLTFVWKRLGRLIYSFPHWTKRFSPRSLIIIGIVLLVIVGISAWQRTHLQSAKQHQSASREAEIAGQITGLLQSANQSAKANPESARANLAQVHDLLNGANKSSPTLQPLASQYYSLLAQINQLTIVSTAQGQKVADSTSDFAVIGQYLFTVQAKNGSVWRQTWGSNAAPEKIFTLPNNATILNFAAMEKNQQLIVGSNAGQLFLVGIDASVKPIELQPPDGESWPKIKSITAYQQNLYLLEDESGQIWKYTSTGNYRYGPRSAYLTRSSSVDRQTVAITTDGAMYSLKSDGTISKFLKGNMVAFGPLQIPSPDSTLNNPSSISTDATSDSVFIQDQNRVIEMTKEGLYTHQYLIRDQQIKASYVSPKTKRLWLLSGETVYEMNL